uniref:SOSS complex subunit C n=2 Tax=Cyprinus carpio TaxID=7962 RepID=A0A9J8B1P3_CYPCA
MAANPPGQGFQNKNRVAILAELDKEKRRLIQSQSMNNPGASIPLSRPAVKEFRDQAEQQHIAAQQKAALQIFFPSGTFPLFPKATAPLRSSSLKKCSNSRWKSLMLSCRDSCSMDASL